MMPTKSSEWGEIPRFKNQPNLIINCLTAIYVFYCFVASLCTISKYCFTPKF